MKFIFNFFTERCKISFQGVVDLSIFNVTVRINLEGNYIKINYLLCIIC